LDSGENLGRRRRRKDVSGHGDVEHALADKARMRWFVARAAAGYDNHFLLAGPRLTIQNCQCLD
jgi:hypothetical protein